MVKWKKLLPLLGVFVLVFLLLTIDLGELVSAIKNLNIWYFILCILIAIPSILIKSFKWNLIAKEFNAKKLSIKNTFFYWLAGFAFGSVTPGNLGDFYRGFYLKKHKVSPINSFMTVLIDRIIDIVLLLLLGIFGLLILATRFFTELLPLLRNLTIILLALIFVGLLFMKKSTTKLFLKPIYRFLVPEKYKKDLKLNFHSFYDDFTLFRKKYFSVSIIIILSVISWLLVIAQYFAFLKPSFIVKPFPLRFLYFIALTFFALYFSIISIVLS